MGDDLEVVEPRRSSAQVEKLLRTREARGLRWAITGRAVLIGFGALMLPLTYVSPVDTAFSIVLFSVGGLICAYTYGLARREQRLGFAAGLCIGLDVAVLFTLPFSWYHAVGGSAMSTAYMLKTDLAPLCIVLIAANGLAVRPLYPLLVTGASLLLYAIILGRALLDPRVVYTWSIADSVMGEAVHPGLFVWRLLTIAVVGAFFAWAAHASRRTVLEAVELEHANDEMRRRQSEIVMQGRLSALAGLVAGVAHEVNTPLGVVVSNIGTSETCATRLAQNAGDEQARGRLFPLLSQSLETARQAAGRIGALVDRLKQFAGLDQADVQTIQLEAALDRTLDLIDPEVRRAARIERRYGDTPSVRCRSRRSTRSSTPC